MSDKSTYPVAYASPRRDCGSRLHLGQGPGRLLATHRAADGGGPIQPAGVGWAHRRGAENGPGPVRPGRPAALAANAAGQLAPRRRQRAALLRERQVQPGRGGPEERPGPGQRALARRDECGVPHPAALAEGKRLRVGGLLAGAGAGPGPAARRNVIAYGKRICERGESFREPEQLPALFVPQSGAVILCTQEVICVDTEGKARRCGSSCPWPRPPTGLADAAGTICFIGYDGQDKAMVAMTPAGKEKWRWVDHQKPDRWVAGQPPIRAGENASTP